MRQRFVWYSRFCRYGHYVVALDLVNGTGATAYGTSAILRKGDLVWLWLHAVLTHVVQATIYKNLRGKRSCHGSFFSSAGVLIPLAWGLHNSDDWVDPAANIFVVGSGMQALLRLA